MKGSIINLEYPSVGATENIMLAASGIEDETIIINAAKEPEICDLAKFLRLLGISIMGEGTSVITLRGQKKVSTKVEFTVMPDRIVAGTYLISAAVTEGEVLLTNVGAENLHSLLEILTECGCTVTTQPDSIYLKSPGRLKSIDVIRTMPYPGFPTDLQAPVTAMLTICDGTSIIIETIFENRFKHVNELMRMGADIIVDGRSVIIKGVKKLKGANVTAGDLRGGASLLIAGLAAEGRTVIEGVHHIERGYEDIEKNILLLGGNIHKLKI
jgi:UDP-N-acetylglucosamine 1-carboxyvinyltransferase